jgi:hypothetical protein
MSKVEKVPEAAEGTQRRYYLLGNLESREINLRSLAGNSFLSKEPATGFEPVNYRLRVLRRTAKVVYNKQFACERDRRSPSNEPRIMACGATDRSNSQMAISKWLTPSD